MRFKKTFALCVCLFAVRVLSYALPFSFQINQFDMAKTEVSEASFMFEDIMLGYFFDAGYVVSNFPPKIITDPNNIPETRALDDAREGYLDYVALIVLVFDRNAKQSTSDESKFLFTHAAWKLYRVADGRLMASGKIASSDFVGKDAETTLKNCARNLSLNLDSVLKKI
jgi:hypothetical protein